MKKVRPNAYRAVWDHMLKRDPCSICGESRSTTIDHIQPKALGGSKGSWTNRTGMCRPCNAAKAHTPLLFFMLERQGIDISFLKDEEGDWPIPETRPEPPADEEGPTGREASRFNIHEIINQATENKARPSSEQQLAENAERWLADQLTPHDKACSKCKGRCSYKKGSGHAAKTCPRCLGSGREALDNLPEAV